MDLTLIQQPHARQAKHEQSGGAMFGGRKHPGYAAFVMIFQKMSSGGALPDGGRQQLFPQKRLATLHQSVAHILVVSVIEAQGLQSRLQTPVSLREK